MANITKALTGKAEKTLSKRVNYSGLGIMTRKERMDLAFEKGWVVEQGEQPRVQYNRAKYNRMTSTWEQDEYMKKCEERIPEYRLKESEDANTYWEITKTEFDYFNSLKTYA